MLDGQGVDGTLPEKVELARTTVLTMVEEGEVELWRTEWPPTPATSRPLDPRDADRLATEDGPWFEPEKTDLVVEIRLTMRA